MEVYDGKLVVMESGNRSALFSLETGTLLSDYIYQDISPFRDGYAMMRLNNRWGIMNLNGVTTLPFQYNYLSYMGEAYTRRVPTTATFRPLDANGNLTTAPFVRGLLDASSMASHGMAPWTTASSSFRVWAAISPSLPTRKRRSS